MRDKIMPTTVVNKYKDKYDVYIGRGSKWGNPFTHKQGTKAEFIVETREEAVKKFEEWFLERPQLIREAYEELNGKVLGCFCKPQACHGDVICKYVNTLDRVMEESKKMLLMPTYDNVLSFDLPFDKMYWLKLIGGL